MDLDSKVVEKSLRTMSMKFDHVVTTIIKSHDTNTLFVAKLQGRIESHVNRILEKTKKVVKEESLKSQVNFNNTTESSCTGEERVQSNYNNRGRENIQAEAEEIMEKEDVAILTMERQ